MSLMNLLQPKTEKPAPPAVRRTEAEEAASPAGPAAEILRLQRTVGNRSVGRMLAASAPVIQRADAPAEAPPAPAPDPTLAAVAAVRSFQVDQNLVRDAVGGARKQLDQRLRQRERELKKYLAHVGENSKVGQAVQADLKKELDDILESPDSRFVNPGMRKDVLDAHAALEAKQQAAAQGEAHFHRYDTVFAGKAVADTLAAKGFTPAELKALVSQESGDLLAGEGDANVEGPAGLAQIDQATAKAAGDPTGQKRLAAATAIPMAAQVLVMKSTALEKGLQEVPTGEEYKKFVYAAYNAGEGTIQQAQRLAKGMGRPGTTWSDLIRPVAGKGIESSPFYRAADALLRKQKVEPGAKYKETTDYVERIRGRLGLDDAAERTPATTPAPAP